MDGKSIGLTTAFAISTVVVAATLSHEAKAGGFAIREQSATFQGLSFAGAAAPGGGISSMFWNPAAVTETQGIQAEGAFSLILPDIKINPTTGTFPFLAPLGPSGDIGVDALVPSFYTGFQFNERFYFGLSVNGPFGLATKPNFSWAGQTYARTSEVFSLNVAPTVGYKINDYVSLGAGLQVQYMDVTLKQAVPVLGIPRPTDPSAILNGDNTSVGFTVGLSLTPFEGTEIGIGYRSTIEHELEGSLRFPGLPTAVPIAATLKTPDLVTLSVRQRITDAFTLLGTVEWSNWSRLGTIPINNRNTGLTGLAGTPVMLPGVGAVELPFEYKDGWFFALGGEYDWQNWTLRAGVGYELSPVSLTNRSPRLPDDDRLWLSAGASYRLNDTYSFDLGYTFISTSNTKMNVGAGNIHFTPPLTLNADVDSSTHIISAGFKVQLGNLFPHGGEPVVAKN